MAVEANPRYGESSLILTTILLQLSIAMQLIFYFKNIGVFTESSASLGRETLKINKQTKRKTTFSFPLKCWLLAVMIQKQKTRTGEGKVFWDLK